jgi:hypothetical protein
MCSNISSPRFQHFKYPKSKCSQRVAFFGKLENDQAPGGPKRATSEIACDLLVDAECFGNVSMLFAADDISSEEKIILRSYLKTTGAIAGCQQVRKTIGACCFGFRVVHGKMSSSYLEGCLPCHKCLAAALAKQVTPACLEMRRRGGAYLHNVQSLTAAAAATAAASAAVAAAAAVAIER